VTQDEKRLGIGNKGGMESPSEDAQKESRSNNFGASHTIFARQKNA